MRISKIRNSEQGMALITVIVLLVLLTAGVTFALRSSTIGTKLSGQQFSKRQSKEVTHSALQIIEKRINDRMNPPMTRADGSGWDTGGWPTVVENQKYQEPTANDGVDCPGHCWLEPNTGVYYHGYQFQVASTAQPALNAYKFNFEAEGAKDRDDAEQNYGIFKPCLVGTSSTQGCAKDKKSEWRARLVEAVLIPTIPPKIDIHGDNTGDPAYQLVIEIIAGNPDAGTESIIRSDLVIVVGDRSDDQIYSVGANVLSKMSLISGNIFGTIAQYLNPDALPQGRAASNARPKINSFYFGEQGNIHWSCKNNGLLAPQDDAPCRGMAGATNSLTLFHDYEDGVPNGAGAGGAFFSNMWVERIATDLNVGQYINVQVPSGSPPVFNMSNGMGLTVGDNNTNTGNPDGTDVLVDQSDLVVDVMPRAQFGRNEFGDVDSATALKLATDWNTPGVATITSTDVSGDGIGGCIFQSSYLTSADVNANLPKWCWGSPLDTDLACAGIYGPAAAGRANGVDDDALPSNKSGTGNTRASVILAPYDNLSGRSCNITITGRYVIDGDLIIAGDGNGKFSTAALMPAGAAGPGIFVTGNVYILNDIRMNNDEPAPAIYRVLGYDSTTLPGTATQLSIAANGWIIAGNLANSNVYSYIMTSAAPEIPYHNLDLNGDGLPDFIIPDGKRPGSHGVADTLNPIQINRVTCQQLFGFYYDEDRMVPICDSTVGGIFPLGSNLVTSLYNFAFFQDGSLSRHDYGHGYVRNAITPLGDPANSHATVQLGGELASSVTMSTVRRRLPTDPQFKSNTPVVGADRSDLFQSGWIDTKRFRQFAGANISIDNSPSVAYSRFHQHDSFDPSYISRVHQIFAKLYSATGILGMASLEDKYSLQTGAANPDSPFRPLPQNLPAAYTNPAFSFNMIKNPNRYATPLENCTTDPFTKGVPYVASTLPSTRPLHWGDGSVALPDTGPRGLEIFGGVYAPYVNIFSTSGLCIYHDKRSDDMGAVRIRTLPGQAFWEDRRDFVD